MGEFDTYALIKQAQKDGKNVLDLSNKGIRTLPSEIGDLSNLIELDLRGNEIKSLPKELSTLSNLEILELSYNPLPTLPKQIGNLSKLRGLYARGCEITSFPEEILNLRNLKFIYLGKNNIKRIPKDISNLKNLEVLNLVGNRLSVLPKELFELKQLWILELSNNFIENLSDEISQLYQLQTLRLNENLLSAIPLSIKDLLELKLLDLCANNIPIPHEIARNTLNPNRVISYFFNPHTKLKGESIQVPLNEAKVIIVGQGSVGKTSLANRLLYNKYNSDENKTDGIEISKWKIRQDEKEFTLNVWDFGGQEIMHATHQFFITKRSLYILVLDSRLSEEENRMEYWLKIIQTISDNSPVIIVGNKTEQQPLDIDRSRIRTKYPNVKAITETSCVTSKGIEELKAIIANEVMGLQHIQDNIPQAWLHVKRRLEQSEKNFIPYGDFVKMCQKEQINDRNSYHTLIDFLHDLGTVIYFRNEAHLASIGILNPQWVTNAVYKIINSSHIMLKKGVFEFGLLAALLDSKQYDEDKYIFIIDIMKKFEVCYTIEADKIFLIPDLLPKDEPAELKFNGVPAFEYAYPVLPSSVITRFIVRMNQKIDDGIVWRTGVVLKIGENKALVKADIEDRKITIAIDGLEHTRRDTLAAIFYHLNDIHESIKGLNPEKLVPVPGAKNAKPIPYDYLLMLEAKGIEILPVQDGNRLIDVNIRKVLSGVPSEAHEKGKENMGNVTNIIVGGNFDGNLTVGDGNQSFKDSYNKITTSQIDIELKQTLKELAQAVEAMTKLLNEDQSAEVAEDLGKLVNEAIKPKPDPKWYSVSIEGLIKAAENLDKLGEPVISLSRKVLSLLTSMAIK